MSRNLTFNADLTSHIVELPIIDDHIVEHSEIINLTLVSTDPSVVLSPSTSTITIEDADSKLLYVYHFICKHKCNLFTFTTSVITIGFNKTAYSVSEDAGSVTIMLSVQIGALDRDGLVTLSSINGTAMCKL